MQRADATDDAAEDELPMWVVKRASVQPGAYLPPGFPFICDANSSLICQPPLLFMVDKHLSRDGKWFNANTVEAYTSDLLDWMRYATRCEIPWDAATWQTLANYIASMDGHVSPHTGQIYRDTTPNRRIVPILGMYQWAIDSKHAPATSGEDSLFNPKNVAEFLDDRRKALRNKTEAGPTPVAEMSLTNVMEGAEAKAILERVGPAPSETWSEDYAGESSVAHIGMELGLHAGLRLSEVDNLKVSDFERYKNIKIEQGRFYTIGPIKRKGGKKKPVKFHGVLLQKIMDYLNGERTRVMKGKVDHGFLLVHGRGRYSGQRISQSFLPRKLATACISAGITRTVEKAVPVADNWAQTSSVQVCRHVFTYHDLRHTYSVWTYYARKASCDAEPWKFIQEQLGHEDVLTTIKTYLHVTSDFEAFASDAFIRNLNRLAGLSSGDDEE